MGQSFSVFEETDRVSCPSSWNNNLATRKELMNFLQDNWNQRDALFNDANKTTKQQFLTIGSSGQIRTNNYIGTISFKGDVINIFPKVFNVPNKSLDVNDLINNLACWLDYCYKFDARHVPIKSSINNLTNLKELFMELFVRKVELIFEKYPYFTYEEQCEDLSVIRGRFNVANFYTKKIPSGTFHKFNCEYSSFEFDNLLNQIIKQVCEHISKETKNKRTEKRAKRITVYLHDVKDVKCSARDCLRVKLNKIQSCYFDILSMCKMFLLNKEPSYSLNTDDTFCFLFPSEYLFEGFIGGFIRELLLNRGGRTELQKNIAPLVDKVMYDGKSYGPAFRLRPDILCTLGNKQFLLDTKYKQIDRFEKIMKNDLYLRMGLINGVEQQDIYQMSVYALKNKLDTVYLIYPLNRLEELEPNYPVLQEIIVTNNGNPFEAINVVLMRVPFVFEHNTDETKEKITKVLCEIFDNNIPLYS